MIPLEVTHKVLATPDILTKLANIDNLELYLSTSELDPSKRFHLSLDHLPHRHVEYKEISHAVERHKRMTVEDHHENAIPEDDPEFSSKFAECCYQLLTFFRGTYCKEFGFTSPPLHDPCTIFYLTHPECFRTLHLYVDVETGSEKCAGRTLCDINNLWGKQKNVTVCTDIDTDKFWQRMLHCVKDAAGKSPLK